MIIDIVKIIIPATAAFAIGIIITPFLTHYLYRYRAWKKNPGKTAITGEPAHIFNELHKDTEAKIPRMGGIVIWGSVLITTVGIWLISFLFPHTMTDKLDFLSRNQTWVPFFALMFGAIIGFVNDFFDVTRTDGRGIRLIYRLLIVSGVALLTAWWFYDKLDIMSVSIPFNGEFSLGIFFIPFFLFVTLCLYAGGVIDGVDGLSGGVFATIFAAYAGIAFFQNQIDLAALCATIVGATLAFLWFNVPPARFYMTETGTMGLTVALAVVVFMTDALGEGIGVSILPIIAFPLVITVLSNVIQITSKKLFGKKVFRVAPLHHHFEAIGWPSYKVTMRYWIIGIMFALVGMMIAFIG